MSWWHCQIVRGAWVRLNDLPKGAIFETRDGIRAVKSEYYYDSSNAPQRVLLASGEYAHFPGRGAEMVREIRIEGVTP